MYRYCISDDMLESALERLDESDIPWDTDSGGRIMVKEDYADEAVRLWDLNGIGFYRI